MSGFNEKALAALSRDAVRRELALDANWEATSAPGEPLSVRHITGDEFLLEVKVLPMGAADG